MLRAISIQSLISEGLDSLNKQAKVRGIGSILTPFPSNRAIWARCSLQVTVTFLVYSADGHSETAVLQRTLSKHRSQYLWHAPSAKQPARVDQVPPCLKLPLQANGSSCMHA